VQVLLARPFRRFADKAGLTPAALLIAADEISRGLWDADLGGGLVKKRVAGAGRGRRGGFRVIVAWRGGDRLVFLFGYAKNQAATLTEAGRRVYVELSKAYLSATPQQIAMLLRDGDLTELTDG
jgi:hypothetical protein